MAPCISARPSKSIDRSSRNDTAGEESHPQYNALSYAWGAPNASSRIVIDGKSLPITRSLAAALQYLRPTKTPLPIWIDQICINQEDHEEKSVQVGIMDKIYRLSEECLVWLGPPADGSDNLMELLIHIGEFAEEFGLPGLLTRKENPAPIGKVSIMNCLNSNLEDPMTVQYHEFCDNVAPLFTYEVYESLIAFQKREWFQRLWVLQEYIMPKEVTMICGSKRIRAEILMSVAWMIIATITNKRCPPSLDDNRLRDLVMQQFKSDGRESFLQFATSRNRRKRYDEGRSNGDTLYELLQRANVNCFLQSTQACDKVFALLGIASDVDQLVELGLRVDYTPSERTAKIVFTRATRALIKSGSVEVLLFAQHFNKCANNQTEPSSQKLPGLRGLYTRLKTPKYIGLKLDIEEDGLPSWVPDWRQPIKRSFSWLCGSPSAADFKPLFSASKGMKFELVEQTGDGSILEDHMLAVKGHCVDEIEQMGKAWNGGEWLECITYLEQVSRMCLLARNIPGTKQVGTEAEWRVPVGDIETDADSNDYRAQSTLKDAYDKAFAAYATQVDFHMMLMKDEIVEGRLREIIPVDKAATRYMNRMKVLQGKRPFISKYGYVGMGPESMLLGDIIVIIGGSTIPFVVRPAGPGTFWLVGECYCHGIMDGEVVEAKKADGVDPETIILV